MIVHNRDLQLFAPAGESGTYNAADGRSEFLLVEPVHAAAHKTARPE